jgi:hypothetical protein
MQTQNTTASTRYIRSHTNPNRFYLVVLNPRGFYECECKAAQFNRREPCKHVKALVKEGAGLVAKPKAAPTPAPLPTVRRARTSAEGLAFAASLDV